ncbi:MAG: hypothetical protein HY078_13130 [Elusimicrobia bacterium]|nr:hypothetical protein [Elusimicrobiota bacterium]
MRSFLFLYLASFLSAAPALAASFSVPPALVEQMGRLRGSPQFAERVQAFDALVDRLGRLTFAPLEEAIRGSRIDARRVEAMRKEAKGVIGVQELLRRRDVEGGYSLGLSLARGEYAMLSERMDLTPWAQAYARFGIDWRSEPNHTAIFLEKIRASQKPIVMLVPAGMSRHPNSVTTREFDWFFQGPERMRTTLFVFGAYSFLTPEMEALRVKAGISRDAFRALVMRALGHGPSSWEQGL